MEQSTIKERDKVSGGGATLPLMDCFRRNEDVDAPQINGDLGSNVTVIKGIISKW